MNLGQRIKTTLQTAGLSPRHLGGATRVHFVTIYRIINRDDDNIFPSTEHILVTALDKIDSMVEAGQLPLTEKLSRKEKTERLAVMLANHND